MPLQFIAVAAMALSAAGVTADPVPTPAPGPPACEVTQDKHRAYVKAVYERDRISSRARRRIDRLRSCAKTPQAARNMRRIERRESRARRERDRAEACTPFGEWAIPPYIVMRESHGQNVPNSQGSDASGFYQVLDSSFHAYGGPDLPGRYDAMNSPKYIQDCVANRMWNGGLGASHWAATI